MAAASREARLKEYAQYDALGLADLVRRREVASVELVDEAIRRAEAHNPALNAIVHPLYDRAREQAARRPGDGVFAGVPFLVKDLDGFLAGVPYTAGSRLLKEFVPDHDAEIVARQLATGVVVLGKTNCPEFGIVATTEPELRGATRNPWSPEHTPGGSSGGAAAAVAAGIVPMAHGGDGGGSIRIPASACGLFGLKPTRARNPLGPDLGEGWGGMVVPHVLSRSVRDSAAMLDATAGPDPGAPYHCPPPGRPFLEESSRDPGRLKVAFSPRSLFGTETHRDCSEAVAQAARLLTDLGHDVEEDFPKLDFEEARHAYLVVVAAGVAATIETASGWAGRRARPSDVEAPTWFLGQVGRALTAADLQRARDVMHRAGRVTAAFQARYDVFVTPTLAYPPAQIGELALRPAERAGLGLLRAVPFRPLLMKALRDLAARSFEKTPNTMLFNQTGQPAMSVPLHWNKAGLPIGVQVAGRFADEATLLRLAGQLEKARPWAKRRPEGFG